MTSNVINLRQARKAKARREKEREADENRRKYGLSKSEREKAQADRVRQDLHLDGHQTEGGSNAGEKDDGGE